MLVAAKQPVDRKRAKTSGDLEAIAQELTRNSRAAEEKQCRHEALIIKMARELDLNPRPAGHNASARMADCPQSGNHWIIISPERDEFGYAIAVAKAARKSCVHFMMLFAPRASNHAAERERY